MDHSNIQSTSVASVDWRAELGNQDRARFIVQLTQALKHLSPAMTDDSILIAAKNFEITTYNRSVNKNQYLLVIAKKLNQIRYQIQMQMQTSNKAASGGIGGIGGISSGSGVTSIVTNSPSISVQQGQPTTSPQIQMMQQQTQNMSNVSNPTQQMFMQPQNTTSQQTLIQNQQPNQQFQNQHQNHISSDTTASQKQQHVIGMNPPASLPVVPQNYNGQTLMSPSQQQQQQQMQVFLARQRALQQQQQQMNTTMMTQNTLGTNTFGLANMNINRSVIPVNSANSGAASIQHINMARQNQSTFPMAQASPELAAQFKLQCEQLSQQQRLQLNSCNPTNLLQLKQLHQRQIQQLQQSHLRQLQQQQQQQQGLTGLQQQPAQTNTFIQHQPVRNGIQQQQQQQQLDSTPLLQQTQTSISAQQRNQATNMVRQLDENIRTTRVQAPALNNLADQEKQAIWENVMQMRPLYEKISQLLPIFLALSSNFEATRRLIMMKYLFEDQLNALPRNIYLITLDRLHQVRQQFTGYFMWVRNAVNGNGIPISQPQPQTQPQGQHANLQTQGQQINQQSQGQQLNYQTPPITTSSPSMQYSSSNSPPIKRENIDLTLPPSKKPRPTTEQPTMTVDQQQEQASTSTNIPATVQWPQVENSPTAIPDCAQASMKTDTPPSVTNSTPTSSGIVPDATRQQNMMTTTMQNDSQSQMMYQAAISSGIPSVIVALLPPQALKCFWLLHQGSWNKVILADEQKIQLRRMLDDFISQAKGQLSGNDHRPEQQQQQKQHDTPASNVNQQQQQLHTIDLTLSPPPTTTNNLNEAKENLSTEKGTASVPSLPPQGFQQVTNGELSSSGNLTPSTSANGTTRSNAPISTTTHTPIVSTTTIPPAILTASPIFTNLGLGMAQPGDVNHVAQYANDVIKDVSTLMTNSSTLITGTSSTPLFVMDDFIIDSNNNKPDVEEPYNNKNSNTTMDKNSQAVLFSSSTTTSESPSSLVQGALKEGFKDETFCINELDSNNLPSSTNNGSSSCPDQSSNTSSLSSTSLSTYELNEDSTKSNWYQNGIDKDSLGIADSIPGFDFDTDGFMSYDSGNRLSHPPLF